MDGWFSHRPVALSDWIIMPSVLAIAKILRRRLSIVFGNRAYCYAELAVSNSSPAEAEPWPISK